MPEVVSGSRVIPEERIAEAEMTDGRTEPREGLLRHTGRWADAGSVRSRQLAQERSGGAPPAIDTLLYESGLVRIGAFRAAADHPRFPDLGPITQPIFVFPRTSVVIRHEGRDPFHTDLRTVTFYNAGQRYSRRPVDARGDLCDWFGLRPDVLRDVLGTRDPAVAGRETEIFPFSHGPSDVHSYALQRLVVRHVKEASPPDSLVVDEAVLEVLDRIAALAYGGRHPRDGAVGGCPGRPSGIAHGVRVYLIQHHTGRFTLEDLAEAVGASVAYMCRTFKREVGTTIHRYREELRLRRSLEMVAAHRDLTAVALELGYSSHSHLTASFRRALGMTPSEFRARVSARKLRELRERLAPI